MGTKDPGCSFALAKPCVGLSFVLPTRGRCQDLVSPSLPEIFEWRHTQPARAWPDAPPVAGECQWLSNADLYLVTAKRRSWTTWRGLLLVKVYQFHEWAVFTRKVGGRVSSQFIFNHFFRMERSILLMLGLAMTTWGAGQAESKHFILQFTSKLIQVYTKKCYM